MRKHRRDLDARVNAGSMADMDVMLLIFFLVTTAMDTDQGITVKLPPWIDYPVESKIIKRNVFSINLDLYDQLLVRGELTNMEDLKNKYVNFILNPADDPAMSSAPNKAVIAYKCDRATSYDAYIQIYDRLKSTCQKCGMILLNVNMVWFIRRACLLISGNLSEIKSHS